MLFQCDSELIPSEPLIQLKTKSTTGVPIFMVHPIEGVASPLDSLAAELERPVWAFQCTSDAPLDSMSELAEFYIEKMKKIQKDGPYHIVGYSFGASAAFEMGLQLENEGEEAILTLLDGAPDYIKLLHNRVHKYVKEGNNTLSNEYRKILAFFVKQLNPNINFVKTYNLLQQIEDDDQMLDKMVELIDSSQFPPEDIKTAGILYFKKVRAGVLHNPRKYKGKLTLIRSTNNFVYGDDDYGLSKICEQNIHIEEIVGDHRSILTGDNAKKISELLRLQ